MKMLITIAKLSWLNGSGLSRNKASKAKRDSLPE